MKHMRSLFVALVLWSLSVGFSWAAPARVVPADSGARTVTPPTTQPAVAGATAPAAELTGEKYVGWISLSGPVRNGPPPFAWMKDGEGRPSLRKILSQLRYAGEDPKVKGVVLNLDEPELTLAQVTQIAAAIRELRTKHQRRVLVYAEAYDLKTYLLACAADKILLREHGAVELTGLALEEMYLAGLFEKIGVKADFLQIGKYKGADEALTRKGPSPEWSQNIDKVLDDLYAQVVDIIAQGRGLTRPEVEQAMAQSLAWSDQDYLKHNLVDRLVTGDVQPLLQEEFELDSEIVWDTDLGYESPLAQMDNPMAILQVLFQRPTPRITRPTIALLHCYGAITSGPSANDERIGFFSSQSIGSRTLVKILDDLHRNKNIKGIVVHIDSPGGSALASEVIWQALRQVQVSVRDSQGKSDKREAKPVYVSIGDMAASGGYYIAVAGQRLYAEPSSLIGSIGVVGGKIVLGGLYDKIGLSVTRRVRGPLGDLYNDVEPFTFRQRQVIEQSMRRTYDQFLNRVEIGRGRRIQDLDAVAQGRLFTGRQALTLGMIDKLGGVEDALADLARELKLTPGQYDVVSYPEPMTLPQYLDQLLGVHSPAPQASLEALGAWRLAEQTLTPTTVAQARSVFTGLLLLRQEPVLALLPAVITIK